MENLVSWGSVPSKRSATLPLDQSATATSTHLLTSPHQQRAELDRYNWEKEELRSTKARLLVVEDEQRQLKWEYEVAALRFDEVKTQRDKLAEKFQATVYETQQKSGFRNVSVVEGCKAVDVCSCGWGERAGIRSSSPIEPNPIQFNLNRADASLYPLPLSHAHTCALPNPTPTHTALRLRTHAQASKRIRTKHTTHTRTQPSRCRSLSWRRNIRLYRRCFRPRRPS